MELSSLLYFEPYPCYISLVHKLYALYLSLIDICYGIGSMNLLLRYWVALFISWIDRVYSLMQAWCLGYRISLGIPLPHGFARGRRQVVTALSVLVILHVRVWALGLYDKTSSRPLDEG